MTRETCVCWSINSDTSTRYGSRVFRHGRSRPLRRYQSRSRRLNADSRLSAFLLLFTKVADGSFVDRPSGGPVCFRDVGAIHDHLRALERDQTAADHLIQLGKNRLNALFGFDAL